MARRHKEIQNRSWLPSQTRLPRRFFMLVGLCLLLPTMAASIPSTGPGTDAANAACIRCHVTTYKNDMAAAFMHPPFFEKHCRTCHVTAGSQAIAAHQEAITGSVVDQGGVWSKRLVFSGSDRARRQHRVRLSGLTTGQAYRFRLVVAHEKEAAGNGSALESLWLGLAPRELTAERRFIRAGLTSPINTFMEELTLQAPSPDVVEVAWQTSIPLLSRVEVQQLSGPDFTEESSAAAPTGEGSAQADHPQLRSPEELAIDACYQCHPQATLGASHPVRLYSSGTETRIPDELPTVNGMLTCVTCHDSHGAPGKNLVRHAVKTRLCVACHYKFKNRSLSTMFN